MGSSKVSKSLFPLRFNAEEIKEKKYLFTKRSIKFKIDAQDLERKLGPKYIKRIKKSLIENFKELGAEHIKDKNNNVDIVIIDLFYYDGCTLERREFGCNIVYSELAIEKLGITVRGNLLKKDFFQSGNQKIVEVFCRVAEEIIQIEEKQNVEKMKS